MRQVLGVFSLLLIAFPYPGAFKWGFFARFQANIVSYATITSPTPGQVLFDGVEIRGNTSFDGFSSYEIDYSDENDPTHSWVPVMQSTKSVKDGILAKWDTTRSMDGEYTLRLLVTDQKNQQQEVLINHLLVRNSTRAEAETSSPGVPVITQVGPTLTPIATSYLSLLDNPPSPTPQPANPAEITTAQLGHTFGKGALLSVVLFILLGAYLAIQTYLHARGDR